MGVHIVVLEVLGQHQLGEDVGVQVGGGLVAQQLGLQLLVADAAPADTHTGGHDLGEGAQHAALLAQLLAEAVGGLAGEAQLAVGIILDEQDVGTLQDLNHLVVDFLGVAQAGGVLEIGDDIDELGVGVGLDGLRELLAVDAVGVDLDGDNLGVEHVEGLQGH